MRSLDFQSGPYRHVDATASPQAIVRHVSKLLETKVFHAQTAFDGMEHLGSDEKSMTPDEATAFAQALPLFGFSTDAEGLARLNKLARVVSLNPDVVNRELPPAARAPYYQALHDHIEAVALDVADLAQPADVAPFEINTFGPPVSRPPIRVSPAHSKFMRDELAMLREHALILTKATPWASPCFPVPKPRSVKLRLVIDFRALNAQTRRDSFPLPYIHDVVRQVG